MASSCLSCHERSGKEADIENSLVGLGPRDGGSYMKVPKRELVTKSLMIILWFLVVCIIAGNNKRSSGGIHFEISAPTLSKKL